MITHSEFVKGNATTRMIDVTPSLFKFKARKDRASKILNYLGEVMLMEILKLKETENSKSSAADCTGV